jgi:hypothetical protein
MTDPTERNEADVAGLVETALRLARTLSDGASNVDRG